MQEIAFTIREDVVGRVCGEGTHRQEEEKHMRDSIRL